MISFGEITRMAILKEKYKTLSEGVVKLLTLILFFGSKISIVWRSIIFGDLPWVSCIPLATKSAQLDLNLILDVLLQNKLQWGSLDSFLSE